MPTTLTTQRQYKSEFEETLTTLKTPAQIARFVRREVKKEKDRLIRLSPVSTGLLKRSWDSYVNVRALASFNPPSPSPSPSPLRNGLLDRPLKVLLPPTVVIGLPPILKNASIVKLGGAKLTSVKVIIAALRRLAPTLVVNVAIAVVALLILKLVQQYKMNRVRIYFKISNLAPNSYYRIVGRPAGKAPPSKRLADWAVRRGLPASVGYAVAKKIAAQGTDRYRSGQNIIGINPTARSYRADAPFVKLINKVLAYL